MFEMGADALLFLQGTLRCEPNAEARPLGFPGVVWPIQQKLDFFFLGTQVFLFLKSMHHFCTVSASRPSPAS